MKRVDENIIISAYEQMISYIKISKNGQNYVEDPNDGDRVVGHYGESHLCAALLLASTRLEKTHYKEVAISLLKGILHHWNSDKKASDYHADFNNFALSIIYEHFLNNKEMGMATQVLDVLMESEDSSNHTVNWLPMRAYTNLLRYETSNNDKYLKLAQEELEVVKSAQYDDGMFDDLLPKGESFNLQYCISTAAELLLIYNRFESLVDKLPKINLSKTAKTLYALILPDGDINYMGRGCNQIFAWGPWLYFMEGYQKEELQGVSLDFLTNHLPKVVNNQNLMLNSYSGKDRVLWWDYHHYTVYMAHFLLWNELTYLITNTKSIQSITNPSDSGLQIYKNEKYCVVTFSGRKHYLVEKGPSLVALWTKKDGIIFKCGHGPSNGMFSNMYLNPFSAYINHFGLIQMEERPKRYSNRYIRKIYQKVVSQRNSLLLAPEFAGINVEIQDDCLTLYVDSNVKGRGYFVLPMYITNTENITISMNDKETGFRKQAVIPSQYGDINIYTSKNSSAGQWKIVIK